MNAADRSRLLVLTDITSLTAGVREPDDGQSLIRLLLYANEIEIEGLVASSNLGHGQVTRPELIRQAIDAYERDWPLLRRHDPAYPPAQALRDLVRAGQPVAGPKVPFAESVGEGKDTEGSQFIIETVDKRDTRPLWIALWGGSADLAQALWTVRRTRPAAALRQFLSRIRVHSVYDQDSTGEWIKAEFPDLFIITRRHGVRGIYRGGDEALVSGEWVERNVHGHGALGALYPNYNGGDIWGRLRGIKEGDTPSYLGLIPNGLNDPTRPDWGGWGGRVREESPCRWVDAPELRPAGDTDRDPAMAGVHRWRPAFQADFAARLDRCVRGPEATNHAPDVRVAGAPSAPVRAGETVELDARGSTDPKGDRLAFRWSVYPEPERGMPVPEIAGAESAVCRVTLPNAPSGTVVPILLAVTDDGDPPLTRYRRVSIAIR